MSTTTGFVQTAETFSENSVFGSLLFVKSFGGGFYKFFEVYFTIFIYVSDFDYLINHCIINRFTSRRKEGFKFFVCDSSITVDVHGSESSFELGDL